MLREVGNLKRIFRAFKGNKRGITIPCEVFD